MSDKQPQPAAPVPAATIMMLRPARDGTANLEVFMVVRHHQIDFASGALVFPGGKADENDFDTALLPYLTGADEDANMRAIQVCAIREAFEECGILLARPQGSEQLVDAARLEQLEPYREQLNSGAVGILEFLEREQLNLGCDTLVHFAHWITPDMMPKRFDTHFYLARTPSGQRAINDGHETTDAVWLGPQAALDQEMAGTATIIFPTRMNLGKLAETDSVTAALDRFAGEAVVTVLPEIGKDADGTPCLHIPAEAGYIQVTEPLKRVANVAKSK